MRFAFCLGVSAFVLSVSVASALTGRLTNYQVVSAQADSLASSVVAVLEEHQVREVDFEGGTHSTDLFARQRIIEQLLRKNFRLMTNRSAGHRLSILVPLINVSYSAPITSHVFGSSDVIRKIQSSYDVELADSGQVQFAKTYSYSFADTVTESQIPELESGVYDFLHGRMNSGDFFNDVIQPVLFVGSAAVIIYLFFTLRGS